MRLSTSSDSKPDNYQINAKICRLVEHYPCMYDRSHPHYLKKDVVDKAWVKISTEMDDSIPSCKERWRNIRTSFARSINVNKIPSSANRTKPYYLHEELQFLARHITPGIPVSRRPNFYTSADEKSEMIEVPIGEESFDGFAAMAAQNAEEEEEEEVEKKHKLLQQQQRIDEDSAPNSSADEGTMSGRGERVTSCPPTEETQAETMEEKMPVQSSPLPLVQHTIQHQQHQQQSVPQTETQQEQAVLQQQQQLPTTSLPPPPPPAPPVAAMEVERIVAEVPVVPLYPFKKRLRTTEPMMYAEVEPERDVKPTPSELCTPDPDFDATFLQGLLPEMKAMDFRQKILFKKRIYEVIGEIFEGAPNGSATRRTSEHNVNYNGSTSLNNSCATSLVNGYAANYTNACTPNGRSQVHTPIPTPTATPTPASSPNASGYASPLHVFNVAAPPTNTNTAAAAAASVATVNATDLALIRRLSTLLQSPAVVSSTSAMTALPKNVASISSTVRTNSSTPTTAASSSPASAAVVSVHRGAMTRSSAHLLRSSMSNGSAPTSSTSFGSPSSNPAVSHAVKQELLDD